MRVPIAAWCVGAALVTASIALWRGRFIGRPAVHPVEHATPTELPASPKGSTLPPATNSAPIPGSRLEPAKGAAAPTPPIGMVLIRAGTFMMGSNNGHHDEQPVHKVTLSAFYLDKHEVTVKDYRRCVAAGKCAALDNARELFSGTNCNSTRRNRPKHPINCLSWFHAVSYCEWIGKRLPTEAEWEYAARGTAARTYPWGEEARDASRAVVEGVVLEGKTEPVCSKPAGNTPEGACDLAGNVWEWVADWYGAYSSEAQTDPRGPEQGSERVYRGGNFSDYISVRGSLRAHIVPGLVGNLMFGFRCAREIPR